ncbi:MAG: type I-B CRISPR-associated protein Cas5 [Planctomycetota bacterium]|nr:MAG: type I-B CRISPR-associated protein Cas5 [Planctomycetota bacterium]
MRVVAFDVSGPWGLFRKPYAPLSPVSFPFPPPPTVLGLVGSICGFSKEECLSAVGWEEARVAVSLLAPARTVAVGLNLLNTKDGTDRYFRPHKDACRMQIPHEFLRDPAYRLHVALGPAAGERLEEQLRAGRTVYTPVLGPANCLAEVRFVAAGEPEPAPQGVPVGSVVPLREGVHVDYEQQRPYLRARVPAAMEPGRRVTRYQEIVCALDGQPLAVEGAELFRLGADVFAFI